MTVCLPVFANDDKVGPPANRLALSLGLAVEFHDQGEYSPFCNGCFAFAARLAYFRELARWLEVSGSVGYAHDVTPEHTVQSAFPAIGLRPYLPFAKSDQFELGLPIQGLLQVTWTPEVPGAYWGLGVALGPDFRVWVDGNTAISLGGELVPELRAHNPSALDLHTEFNKDPALSSIRAWFAVLGAF